ENQQGSREHLGAGSPAGESHQPQYHQDNGPPTQDLAGIDQPKVVQREQHPERDHDQADYQAGRPDPALRFGAADYTPAHPDPTFRHDGLLPPTSDPGAWHSP